MNETKLYLFGVMHPDEGDWWFGTVEGKCQYSARDRVQREMAKEWDIHQDAISRVEIWEAGPFVLAKHYM